MPYGRSTSGLRASLSLRWKLCMGPTGETTQTVIIQSIACYVLKARILVHSPAFLLLMSVKPSILVSLRFLQTALFLLRDPSFLKQVPEEHQQAFIDSQPVAAPKLQILKKMIKDRFPVSCQVITSWITWIVPEMSYYSSCWWVMLKIHVLEILLCFQSAQVTFFFTQSQLCCHFIDSRKSGFWHIQLNTVGTTPTPNSMKWEAWMDYFQLQWVEYYLLPTWILHFQWFILLLWLNSSFRS